MTSANTGHYIYFLPSLKREENANRVLLPAFCGAENAGESCCPLSAEQKMQASPVARFLRSRKCRRVLLPAFCGAENAGESCCPLLRSRKCRRILLPLSAKQKMQVCPLTRLLSQHHIQQHHNRKAEDNAHGGKIGLRSLVPLAFRDQLMHRHQDHCPGGKG